MLKSEPLPNQIKVPKKKRMKKSSKEGRIKTIYQQLFSKNMYQALIYHLCPGIAKSAHEWLFASEVKVVCTCMGSSLLPPYHSLENHNCSHSSKPSTSLAVLPLNRSSNNNLVVDSLVLLSLARPSQQPHPSSGSPTCPSRRHHSLAVPKTRT
jgi:hypothetical protein